jgi:hypothetical protein
LKKKKRQAHKEAKAMEDAPSDNEAQEKVQIITVGKKK